MSIVYVRLYRMITGKMPAEAAERVQQDKLVPILNLEPKVPKYIAETIEKGLSVYAKDRYQSMEELYKELYSSWQSRFSKGMSEITDRVYRLVKKILIILIICLLVVGGVGIIYRMNSDKIDFYINEVKEIFIEEPAKSNDFDDSKDQEEVEVKKSKTEKTQKETNPIKEEKVVVVEDIGLQKEPVKQETNEFQKVEQQEAVVTIDPRVERGSMVARDGYLNGRKETLTVGEILDAFSESPGTWDGYVDENNQVYIYYQGMRDGSSFAIEFSVYSDDTFKVTGAAQNGEILNHYSEYFQHILEETGVW